MAILKTKDKGYKNTKTGKYYGSKEDARAASPTSDSSSKPKKSTSTVDIITDPVSGRSYSRDTAVTGSTYKPYTPLSTPSKPSSTSKTPTQLLQDQLVKEGYMTQAEVDTGYGTYGPRTTAAVAKKASGSTSKTPTQLLQDQLVKEGYMTQEQVNTGYGIYGPRTTAAVAARNAALGTSATTPTPTPPVDTPTAPETTPEDLLGYIPKETSLDRQIAKGESELLRIKQELAKPETDQQMRDKLTALFQQEIDALNAVYAQQKVEAAKIGAANLGTNRASQARFGLLGSSFGAAETQGIEQQAFEQQKQIDVAKGAALSPIYSKISEEVLKARKEKREAQTTSVEAYIENLKNTKARKEQMATNAIKSMILNKANPTDKDFKDMAKQIGVDPAVFKQEYKALKQTEESSEEKAQRELEKFNADIAKGKADISAPKSIGDYTYMYDPATNSWKNMGKNKVDTASLTETEKVKLKNAITTGAQWLDSQAGNDGFVAEGDYKKAKRDWVLSGLPTLEFDKQFVSFINPAYTEAYGVDKGTFDALKRPSLMIGN